MNKSAFSGIIFTIFIAALLFRLPALGLRPMHHDEANQAVKFGALLEKGEYRYDKADHHGPSLYYLTLPVARAFSKTTLAQLGEWTLRLVPALFGAALLFLMLLFVREMGRTGVVFAALFAAVSPAMVYYSRFYIQEMLFAFFVLGFLGMLWRYLVVPSARRALLAGFFGGMMFATKETSVIVFAAAGGAILLTALFQKIRPQTPYRLTIPSLAADSGGIIVALVVAEAFFSSFFKYSKGILDSFLAFKIYFEKGGAAGLHSHPWWYYLKLLGASKSGTGPLWSEGLILALAVVGAVSGFVPFHRGRKQTVPSPARFVFFYTLLATAAFSLIPYKTPWNLVPFFVGMIVLAGIGAGAIIEAVWNRALKVLVIVALGVGVVHLGALSYLANFKYEADPVNPYVYAQTSPDYMKLVRRVEELAELHPEGRKMLIKVVCAAEETWPLPWSLRGFGRVGYWQDAGAAGAGKVSGANEAGAGGVSGAVGARGFDDAAVVISSQIQAEKLETQLKGKFESEFYGLRPGVFLVLHVRQDLWEKFVRERKAGR